MYIYKKHIFSVRQPIIVYIDHDAYTTKHHGMNASGENIVNTPNQ